MGASRPMRVKSVNPPATKPITEMFLAALMFLAAAALDSQAGRDLWQWVTISAGGPKEATILVVLVMPNVVYYASSAFFAFLDLCIPNAAFVKAAKVQPTAPRPTLAQYGNALLVTGFNTFIIESALVFVLFQFGWPAIGHCAWTADGCATMPKWWWTLSTLLVWVLLVDGGFYWTHRLVHQPPLYKWIHKLHHTFKSPAALTAKYAHPVEHLVSNIAPVMLGPLLFNAHPMVQGLWIGYGMIQTTVVHSGYNLSTWLPQSHSHDWHHEVTVECFGTELGLMDYLFGTAPRLTARMAGKLPVHIVGIDDSVTVDESWEDSDDEGVPQGPPGGGGAIRLKSKVA